MHRSIKRHVDMRRLPVHKIVPLLRAWFKKRKVNLLAKNWDRERKLATTLRKDLIKFGHERLQRCLQVGLTEEGEYIMLRNAGDAIACDVVEINNYAALKCLLDDTDIIHGADAARFKLFCDMLHEQHVEGAECRPRYFRVSPKCMPRSGEGIVALAPNGSWASSSGDFASYGCPDALCLAVVIAGHAPFCPAVHMHDIYKQAYVNSLLVAQQVNFMTDDQLMPTEGASWNWAITFTDELWSTSFLSANPSITVPLRVSKVPDELYELSKGQQKVALFREASKYLKRKGPVADMFELELTSLLMKAKAADVTNALMAQSVRSRMCGTAPDLNDNISRDRKRFKGGAEKSKK